MWKFSTFNFQPFLSPSAQSWCCNSMTFFSLFSRSGSACLACWGGKIFITWKILDFLLNKNDTGTSGNLSLVAVDGVIKMKNIFSTRFTQTIINKKFFSALWQSLISRKRSAASCFCVFSLLQLFRLFIWFYWNDNKTSCYMEVDGECWERTLWIQFCRVEIGIFPSFN